LAEAHPPPGIEFDSLNVPSQQHFQLFKIIVGDQIVSYHNRIFDIDVGMTPRYGENEPAAIVFKKDGVYAFYAQNGEFKVAGF
jgi:hypothetical protein